jgi:mannose/fructose-specific phosphotransferase system component IIA
MMKQKSWVFIITHGHAGEALVKSAEMIAGKMKYVEVFSLEPGMSPEDIMGQIKEKLDEVQLPVLVLTDLYGGTPFNAAMALSRTYNIQLVCGINLSMLIEGDLLRETLSGRELAVAVQKIGSQACCVAELPNKM